MDQLAALYANVFNIARKKESTFALRVLLLPLPGFDVRDRIQASLKNEPACDLQR